LEQIRSPLTSAHLWITDKFPVDLPQRTADN
jgi:hypothetical protein